MHYRFLLFWLNIEFEPSRLDLGAGINFDGYSFDGGKTWWLHYQNQLIPEEDFITGMHCWNSMGCPGCGIDTARLE